jgi:hypothetical protein
LCRVWATRVAEHATNGRPEPEPATLKATLVPSSTKSLQTKWQQHFRAISRESRSGSIKATN